MSTINNNASHLGAGAHSRNNRYYLRSANDSASAVSAVKDSTMGGMVSAITAVLCGTGRRPETDVEDSRKVPTPRIARKYYSTNDDSLVQQSNGEITTLEQEERKHGFTVLESSASCESNYLTPEEGSDTEFVDTSEFVSSSPHVHHRYSNIPYIDEDSESTASSQQPTPRGADGNRSVTAGKNLDIIQNIALDEPQFVEISETEYSADEEELESEQSDSNDEEQLEYETEGKNDTIMVLTVPALAMTLWL